MKRIDAIIPRFLFCVTLVVYTFFLITFFSPLGDCLQGPALKYDFSLHFSNTLSSLEYFTSHFRTWGYNPFFSAGLGEALAPSAKSLLLWFYFLPFVSPEISYNVFIFLVFFSLPLLMMKAVALLSRESNRKYYGYILAVLTLIGSRKGREFLYIGHFGFIWATFLCLPTVAYSWKYFKSKKTSDLLMHSISFSFALLVHPLFIFIYFPFFFSTMIGQREMLSKSVVTRYILFFLLIGLIPHSNWLIPFSLASFFSLPPFAMAHFLQSDGLVAFIENPLLFLFFIGFIVIMFNKKYRCSKIGKLLLFPTLWYFLLLTLGSQFGLGNVQPTRFILSLFFSLLIFFVIQFRDKVVLTIILLATCISVGTFFFDSHYKHGSVCSFEDDHAGILINYINKGLKRDGRLLIQNSVKRLPYFNSRFINYLQAQTKFPLLAAPFPIPLKYHQFRDGIFFGQDINDVSNDRLMSLAEIYNFKYILIHSEKAKEKLETLTSLEKIFEKGRYSIFEVHGVKASYCFKCSAQVTFKKDELVISNASVGSNILKFKFFPLLKTNPSEVRLSPVIIGEDPVPFIRVDNGNIRNYKIYLKTPLLDWSF